MTLYGRVCGQTLARAHARSGDRVAIAAYLGGRDRFDNAIADFAETYADLNSNGTIPRSPTQSPQAASRHTSALRPTPNPSPGRTTLPLAAAAADPPLRLESRSNPLSTPAALTWITHRAPTASDP